MRINREDEDVGEMKLPCNIHETRVVRPSFILTIFKLNKGKGIHIICKGRRGVTGFCTCLPLF